MHSVFLWNADFGHVASTHSHRMIRSVSAVVKGGISMNASSDVGREIPAVMGMTGQSTSMTKDRLAPPEQPSGRDASNGTGHVRSAAT